MPAALCQWTSHHGLSGSRTIIHASAPPLIGRPPLPIVVAGAAVQRGTDTSAGNAGPAVFQSGRSSGATRTPTRSRALCGPIIGDAAEEAGDAKPFTVNEPDLLAENRRPPPPCMDVTVIAVAGDDCDIYVLQRERACVAAAWACPSGVFSDGARGCPPVMMAAVGRSAIFCPAVLRGRLTVLRVTVVAMPAVRPSDCLVRGMMPRAFNVRTDCRGMATRVQ